MALSSIGPTVSCDVLGPIAVPRQRNLVRRDAFSHMQSEWIA